MDISHYSYIPLMSVANNEIFATPELEFSNIFVES